MDPISIAATAASLAGAAGSTAIVLIRLAKKIKNVDIKLSETCEEVKKLAGLLVSVDKTVRQCQTQVPSLFHPDHNLWGHFGNNLADCKSNITGLDQLLRKLSVHFDAEGNSLATLLRKTNLYFILSIHKDEIEDYTRKISTSNSAIQTTLAAVTVALSFRTNISQERLLQEVSKLECLIKESLRKAHGEPYGSETAKEMEIATCNVPYIYFDTFDGEIDECEHPYKTTDHHGGVKTSGRPDHDSSVLWVIEPHTPARVPEEACCQSFV
ncbi:hypothetical protein CcaCcLH18_06031 [Colletotrichum camelliae]|nr:hypothetical protein CcaCcLH18_06031 [Colletotrichum camelliae]